MSEFQELIKRFDKCRDYVRDFFVYGFKSRNDFSLKSARTYDDERRRIESWLSDYVRQDYAGSKNISLQMLFMDCSSQNNIRLSAELTVV